MKAIRTKRPENATESRQLPDDVLIRRLRMASRSDLHDILRVLKLDPKDVQHTPDAAVVWLISSRLRSAAGNSIANLRRGPHDFPYKQIVIDVADKLHPSKIQWTPYKLDDAHTVEEIEDFVYDRIRERISTWLADMSSDRREELAWRIEMDMRKKGYPEGAIQATLAGLLGGTLSGALLAGVVTPVLFGTIWTTLFGFSLAQLLIGGAAVGGPVALTAGVAALVTSTSYSKTIPAIYRLVQIRRSFEERGKL
jgi:hypothetical protein